MDKLSFRDWLSKQGILVKYLRNRVVSLSIGIWEFDLVYDEPRHWVSDSFRWAQTPEGHYFWDDINNKWADYASGGGMEYGMPLDDALGLSLVLAELEDENGKA